MGPAHHPVPVCPAQQWSWATPACPLERTATKQDRYRQHPHTTIPSGHQGPSHILLCRLPVLTSSSRPFRVFPPRKAPSPWTWRKGRQRVELMNVIKKHQSFACWVCLGRGARRLAEGPRGDWVVYFTFLFPLKSPQSSPNPPLYILQPLLWKTVSSPFCR